MATLKELEVALINADKAGDTDAARKLAAVISRARKDPANLIPGTPVIWEEKPEQTISEKIIGAGEAGAALATGLIGSAVAAPVGVVKGIAQSILDGSFGTPEAVRMVEEEASKASEALTYAPRTEAGQEATRGAAEVLSQVLPPFIPMLGGQPGQISTSARMAALPVEAAARAAAPVVREAANRAGQAVRSGVSMLTGSAPESAANAPRPQSVGAAATDPARRRVEKASSLPVPITLTRGAATKDSQQLAFEKEQIKSELGGELRQRAEENNLQTLQNFEALMDMTDAQINDIASTGNKVTKALSSGLAKAKTKTRAAYADADRAGELETGVNLNSVIKYINENLPEADLAPVLSAAKKKALAVGAASLDQDGNLVPVQTTLRNAESLRKTFNNAGFEKGDAFHGFQLKSIFDAETQGLGGNLYQKARRLRTEQARKYENRAIIARLVQNRKNMDDPMVAADKVFKKSISDASPEEITFLKRVLVTSGDDGKQAWKELQGATIRYIRDEATKGLGRDSMDRPIVSPAQMHRTVRALDQNGRLDVIFGKKNAQTIRDLNEVLIDVVTAPPWTLINTSGTAGVLLAGMTDIALTGMLTGLPVPIATGLRQIVKLKKERATKARIIDALNALPNEAP
jgi:hypothetical protein